MLNILSKYRLVLLYASTVERCVSECKGLNWVELLSASYRWSLLIFGLRYERSRSHGTFVEFFLIVFFYTIVWEFLHQNSKMKLWGMYALQTVLCQFHVRQTHFLFSRKACRVFNLCLFFVNHCLFVKKSYSPSVINFCLLYYLHSRFQSCFDLWFKTTSLQFSQIMKNKYNA